MLVNQTELSETSKVWIYPSNRKFYSKEIEPLEKNIQKFIESWKLGDENFKASYQFLYNRFIIIMADDELSPVSMVDIDTSVQFILEMQEAYNVLLLDKMNVCFKQGEYVQYKDLKDFKKLLKNKAVTAKTIVFDNLITVKKELENDWQLAVEESWYKRFL